MEEVLLKVLRYEPEGGGESLFETYRVPFEGVVSVLDVLKEAYEMDGVVCRHSCNIGFCGLCQVLVNGKRRLACKSLVKGSCELVVEPVDRKRLLRDLVTELFANV